MTLCRRRKRQMDTMTSKLPTAPSSSVSPYTRLTGTNSIRGTAARDVSSTHLPGNSEKNKDKKKEEQYENKEEEEE